ncbi:YEATS domain-containing protein 2 isoform X2 [Agrilus planipennis]|uniref:YEATS domain-containing protein 2 isoform X2 n=1 Tax=Agrilus planipennis TaxID=224129 RepID=A0A1W4WTX3_AGRPL|nr:YEATS domain-containing protein 2 isoform X2 [Agrilus planipennis]
MDNYLDPDYEFACVTAERKKIRLEKDQNEALQKAQGLLSQQFEIELKERQSQLELIQDRISRAQKTLHLLRYALITSYYNRKDLEVTFSDTYNEGENLSVDYQKRIHPALKKLIGKDDSNLAYIYSSGLRSRLKTKQHLLDNSSTTQETIDNNHCASVQEQNELQYEYLPKENEIGKSVDNVRNRRKQKYRILIGNISKWMPSDGSTHKWMVYVRGPKESPNISSIVQKVIFHLHPSYKPNDVVELKSAPFHLSRRGWGEFPLRVKIYFHSSLNKPVDVIHNLKLDRTYSGQQTLGNETVVDIFLYENHNQNEHEGLNNINTSKEDFQHEDQYVHYCQSDEAYLVYDEVKNKEFLTNEVTENEYIIKTEEFDKSIENRDEAYCEHNYCYKDDLIKECSTEETLDQREYDTSSFIIDHDYCLPHSQKETFIKDNSMFKIEKVWSCNAGIEETAMLQSGNVKFLNSAERSDSKNYEVQTSHQYFSQEGWDVLCSTNIEVDNKLISMHKSDSFKFEILLPVHHFKTIIEILPFLFKKLPLVTELAFNPKYKTVHPYAASSLHEYLSWISERRLSAEWFRAKLVKEFIMLTKLSNCEEWNTKSIIMFGRAYGFTPLDNYGIFKKTKYNDYYRLMIEHPQIIKPFQLRSIDCELNIDEEKEEKELEKFPKRSLSKLIDSKIDSECSYIRQCAFDVGIVLKPEELIPGLLFNSSERVILQAVICLAENLIRKARACRVFERNYREGECTLTVEDILKVLHHRPELNFLVAEKSDN